SLAAFTATDAFDDPLHRDLPPRAIVLAHGAQTYFRWVGSAAVERPRPDVTVVPVPLLTYPGMIDALVSEAPVLTPLLRGYLLEGRFLESDLQSLAAIRPLRMELDPRVDAAVYRYLVP